MGLDMYLIKETYVGAQYEHRGVKGEITLTRKTVDGDVPINIQTNRVSEIIEHVGYWRKANAIHQWFVDNCAAGVDECQRIYVSEEDMRRLLNDVEHVLSYPEEAPKVIPSQSGFFFGSIDYDEWYIRDLEDTREILKSVLAEASDAWTSFYYQASW